uniref:Protein FAM195A n=1 Tax=Glossina brevipalpis TaxID=37001 RepID=A0A1A9W4D3_9MUSC
MYTVSKGPSKIVAKTRRGLSQNFEKFETIKESSRRNNDSNSPEKNIVPRPVFQTKKFYTHTKIVEEEAITPQHEEIIKYINDSWNIVVAQNPYDRTPSNLPIADANNNTGNVMTTTSLTKAYTSSAQTASSLYCVEPPSPVLSDFKPFDLESWWGRRLFNNITKSL